MVILTMLVERFYMTTQEDGARVALQHLAGHGDRRVLLLLGAVLGDSGPAAAGVPRSHCFTVALMVLIGRYTGYQLLEPWRFRDLADLRPVVNW